ncbi:UNVERIFIED_CONTAM: hypothetical protein FKN15_064239 [Acipenser sinensis]
MGPRRTGLYWAEPQRGLKPVRFRKACLIQNEFVAVGGHVDFEDFVELMGPKLLAETADMIGVKELRDAFKEFDTNGDGEISTAELREAMRKLLGQQVGHRDLEEILRDVDLNGDGHVDFEVGGHVDFEDFVELMGPKLLAETADMIGVKELRDAFKEFDTNGDGEISTAELREAMRKLLGQQVGHRDLEEILRDVDLNGDGHVDFEGETLQGLAASLTELSTGLRQKKWKTFVIEFQFLSCLSAEFVRMMSR